MSKEFNRAVEREFAARMPALGLAPDKPVGTIAWPGERCFRGAGSETLAWICIFPDYKGLNDFNIEIAWSHHGAYPSTCRVRPSPTAIPPECFAQRAEGFLRLAPLCTPPRSAWGAASLGGKLAKLSREEAGALATPLVVDALQAISQFGIPLLAAAAQSRPQFLAQAGA
jgi:hypothetical protein